MKTRDLLKLSINNLFHRKLRSWLTIVGIVIGVAAVVALVSIGQGIQASIQNQLSIFGGNLIFVTPSSTRATFGAGFQGTPITQGTRSGNLTENDLKLVQTVPGIESVDGVLNERTTVKYVNEVATLSVQGVNPSIWRVFATTPLASGRYLNQGDRFSVVLGYNPASTIFKNPVTVNSPISIDGQNFRVVGILQQSANLQADNLAVIPIDIARTLFTDIPSNQFSAFVVKAASSDNVADIASQIESRLLVSHHVAESTKDFTVTSAQSISQTVGQVISTFTFFLGSIAAISLLVGGVGIANTMFMSVIERTRQIGILKALGATSRDVMKLFLVESALIGLVGGTIGVIFGFVVSQIISGVGVRFGFGGPAGGGVVTYVTPEIVLIAIGFSVVIGILSGVIPARQAAKLDPVEALSYE